MKNVEQIQFMSYRPPLLQQHVVTFCVATRQAETPVGWAAAQQRQTVYWTSLSTWNCLLNEILTSLVPFALQKCSVCLQFTVSQHVTMLLTSFLHYQYIRAACKWPHVLTDCTGCISWPVLGTATTRQRRMWHLQLYGWQHLPNPPCMTATCYN